jgi:hypothetical protein
MVGVAGLGVLAIVLINSELQAQPVSFGVKGGVALTPAVESNGPAPGAKRYTVGPTIEIALPLSFAFEGDAIYRRTGYDAITEGLGTLSNTRLRANSWEFPLLGKYYFGRRIVPVRFYATGGYVLRHMSGFDISIHTYGADPFTGMPIDFSTHRVPTQYYVRNNPTNGFVAGGGARLRTGHFAVALEVRYSRWVGMAFDQFGSHGFFVQSLENQADVLVGITF